MNLYPLVLLVFWLVDFTAALISRFFYRPKRPHTIYRFRRKASTAGPRQPPRYRSAPKPPWVREALIRIASRYTIISSRKLAADFNDLHARTGWTVGRTLAGDVLKEHAKAIADPRRALKARRPEALPNHLIWAMDITFVQETPVIGILDHGSRYSTALAPLKNKSSIQLLRALLDAIEATGQIPKILRTDNEACFVSRTFRFGLRWLGIWHERTRVASPWQNGRIERCFGTLKEKLAQVVIDQRHLADNLDIYRFWYNHVRTHQNLDNRKPIEALTGIRATGQPRWFDAWDGVLQGILLKPK